MSTARGFIDATIDRLIGCSPDLPPETCNFEKSELTIPRPNDGPTPAADLHQPIDREPSGTVLVRSPYGRGIMMTMGSAHIFASRSYQVLFVSSRGTFGSTGRFDRGFFEAEAGQGVINWIRQQSWYTGSFITLALNPGKSLRSIIDALPLTQGVDSHISGARSAPWLTHAIRHPDRKDPSWSPLQHGQALDGVITPLLLINGWQDIFLEQTIEQYEKLTARGYHARLIIGPWTHLQPQNKTITRPMLEWLHRNLARRTDIQTGPAVQVYIMGMQSAQ
ncbi:Alpha/Beta hydrolase protein [Ilyonectria robusta]|uniref:Alpha/Beta hydrolase protein n=1 Tax=Ilyonectria robusta TaxID=1079257 RepID=UPI001E8D4FFF|nr:Alpha/Beta hydrolase protein [Ilyonectria robusta]KAH8654157.1 Alpha/Beta hydrolase protein [Ilyonectria robusta]